MLPSYIDIRFPDDIAFGATGGPEFKTDIRTAISGHEKRNISWSNPRSRYNVSHGVKTAEQMQNLSAFFRNCYGKAISFRFKDWSDYWAKAQIIAVADGKSRLFQLIKSYTIDDYQHKRKITKPVANTVQVMADGDLQHAEVDLLSGHVKLVEPPKIGSVITADFEFDVHARFDVDVLNTSIDEGGVYTWRSIPIVEVRE